MGRRVQQLRGHHEGVWIAAKLYPAGATTNSQSGVTDLAPYAVDASMPLYPDLFLEA